MMTRKEVAGIIMYCKEHKVTYKSGGDKNRALATQALELI